MGGQRLPYMDVLRAAAAFDGIVVEVDTAVIQEMTERRPEGEGVMDRVGEAAGPEMRPSCVSSQDRIASTSGRDSELRTLRRCSAPACSGPLRRASSA